MAALLPITAVLVLTEVSGSADAREGEEFVAAWYQSSSAGCQSLITFHPDVTDPSLSDANVLVDCADNGHDIVRVGHVTVSPDGSRIAFNGQDSGGIWGLFIVDVDGTDLATLCEDLDCDDPANRLLDTWNLDWGADDHLYLTLDDREAFGRLSVTTGALTVVPWGGAQPETWNVALAPTADRVVFHDFSTVLLAPATDISASTSFASGSGGGGVKHTLWHPDGDRIVYVDDTVGIVSRSVEDPSDVITLVANGTGPTFTPVNPAVSPDGRRLLYFDSESRSVYLRELDDVDGPPQGGLTYVLGPRGRMGSMTWFGHTVPSSASTGPRISLQCGPLPPTVGTEVSCEVAGADPSIDILWRAAYNPVLAESSVRTTPAGTAGFSFRIPTAAAGTELTVELVEWVAPVPLGVVGAAVPSSIPAGEGPGRSRMFRSDVLGLSGVLLAIGLAVMRRQHLPGRRSSRAG